MGLVIAARGGIPKLSTLFAHGYQQNIHIIYTRYAQEIALNKQTKEKEARHWLGGCCWVGLGCCSGFFLVFVRVLREMLCFDLQMYYGVVMVLVSTTRKKHSKWHQIQEFTQQRLSFKETPLARQG